MKPHQDPSTKELAMTQNVNTQAATSTVDSVFELKAQARRLRNALEKLGRETTHSEALGLIAAVHGHRRWEALEAQAAGQATPAAQEDRAPAETQTQHLLRWLEVALRVQGLEESHLDELLYDVLAPNDAQAVNNSGMRAQLEALYRWCSGEPTDPWTALLNLVESYPAERPSGLRLAGLRLNEDARPSQPQLIVPANVSICAGSRCLGAGWFDATEYLSQLSAAELSTLVSEGWRNTQAANGMVLWVAAANRMVLWLAQHSAQAAVRAEIQGMLSTLTAAHLTSPETVELRVRIDDAPLRAFVVALHSCGEPFTEECLSTLGIR
jgi:hypothetical protein